MKVWLWKGEWPEDTDVIFMVYTFETRAVTFSIDGSVRALNMNLPLEKLPHSWERVA